MERTADRHAFTFEMISTQPIRATRLSSAVAHLVLVRSMRSHVPTTIIALCAALVIAGCVEDRYRYNSQHVFIMEGTHLSTSDREEVLRLLSRETRQPILAISAHQSKTGLPQLYAVSGFEETSEVNPWREYFLEKRRDGWHIFGSGPVGQVSASLMLSAPPSPSPHKKT
jgi:hypothetical protein